MEPPSKRRTSSVWQHFDLISPKKVKCRLCQKELCYSNNTTCMWRHYRALHENAQPQTRTSTRKHDVDEALVDMITKDSQPFSVVEDEGFRNLIRVLDPNYTLPSRQALKAMVEEKFTLAKEKAKEEVQKAAAVSLTADMWSSMNMEAYLGVTCHYITEEDTLNTAMLGVEYFPLRHTAENLALAQAKILDDWGIKGKVSCLVTDAAANMKASVRLLGIRHSICVAHALNLIVRKSFEQVPMLADLREKSRKIVTYFRTSTTAKEHLGQLQASMGRPKHKLLIEVDTRWNSTFLMLERLFEQREAVGAALASLHTDLLPLTSLENDAKEVTKVLGPIQRATVELSEEKRVSGSKVIPLMKMLHHTIQCEVANLKTEPAKHLAVNLIHRLIDHMGNLESVSVMTQATLLDPRFKDLGFHSPLKANEAVKRLQTECAKEMQTPPTATCDAAAPVASTSSTSSSGGSNLWQLLDTTVTQRRGVSNAEAEASVEVQRYLGENYLPRQEDPLMYWHTHKHLYPHLYKLALQFLCIPASSVPCERVFSKAGEVVSKRRNRLSPNTVEKILFLNKNH